MSKSLSEMTLEELWELFPIFLCEHQDEWKDIFSEEKDFLGNALFCNAVISHIGSTAIKDIWAKPIIDILVEVEADKFDYAESCIFKCGYRLMSSEPTRRDYNKGYIEDGFAEHVYHLHLRTFGDRDEIYFRDYLNRHPDVAHEYESLKLSLWKKFEHNRDGYTEAKTDFIVRYTKEAKTALD